MKRRNFLKLLGIGLLPASILPARADTVEPTVETVEKKWHDSGWLILETPHIGMYKVQVYNGSVYSYTADNDDYFIHDYNYDKRCQFLNKIIIKVTKHSHVVVTSPDGLRVWFRPQWDIVEERFETVSIEMSAVHDIFLNDDDTKILESRVITMHARGRDGKLITKSVRETTV